MHGLKSHQVFLTPPCIILTERTEPTSIPRHRGSPSRPAERLSDCHSEHQTSIFSALRLAAPASLRRLDSLFKAPPPFLLKDDTGQIYRVAAKRLIRPICVCECVSLCSLPRPGLHLFLNWINLPLLSLRDLMWRLWNKETSTSKESEDHKYRK